VKDQFEVKDTLVTLGCDHLSDQVVTTDAPIVSMLKDAGAIILVKGNVP
jgi:Asp-tRNA(Asn)/Glu-tRNA(Gln) amidotransferase A subunit family amidase